MTCSVYIWLLYLSEYTVSLIMLTLLLLICSQFWLIFLLGEHRIPQSKALEKTDHEEWMAYSI